MGGIEFWVPGLGSRLYENDVGSDGRVAIFRCRIKVLDKCMLGLEMPNPKP